MNQGLWISVLARFWIERAGRLLKVDPGATAQTQSTFSGGGVGVGIFFEALSMTTEWPEFEIQCTLGFQPHGSWADRGSQIFGVSAAPAAGKHLPKGWEPTF